MKTLLLILILSNFSSCSMASSNKELVEENSNSGLLILRATKTIEGENQQIFFVPSNHAVSLHDHATSAELSFLGDLKHLVVESTTEVLPVETYFKVDLEHDIRSLLDENGFIRADELLNEININSNSLIDENGLIYVGNLIQESLGNIRARELLLTMKGFDEKGFININYALEQIHNLEKHEYLKNLKSILTVDLLFEEEKSLDGMIISIMDWRFHNEGGENWRKKNIFDTDLWKKKLALYHLPHYIYNTVIDNNELSDYKNLIKYKQHGDLFDILLNTKYALEIFEEHGCLTEPNQDWVFDDDEKWATNYLKSIPYNFKLIKKPFVLVMAAIQRLMDRSSEVSSMDSEFEALFLSKDVKSVGLESSKEFLESINFFDLTLENIRLPLESPDDDNTLLESEDEGYNNNLSDILFNYNKTNIYSNGFILSKESLPYRNRIWIPRIECLPDNSLIVAGAFHFVGEGGLISLMSDLGWTWDVVNIEGDSEEKNAFTVNFDPVFDSTCYM